MIGNAREETLSLRRASTADVTEIVRIERMCFSDPWSEKSFADMLVHPAAIFLVASDSASSTPRGYVLAVSVAGEAEILNIAVPEANRGCGIGGRLLDAAIEEIRRRGAKLVFLEVRESNRAARELYRSRGFCDLFRRNAYYRNPVEDALVLSRAIE